MFNVSIVRIKYARSTIGYSEDGDDKEEKKPSGGGVKLVPRAERRRDHRGMASVTTIISGSQKRKATDDSV